MAKGKLLAEIDTGLLRVEDGLQGYETIAMDPMVGTTIGIVYVALIVFFVIVMWKIFTKAGRPGWAAIIPIYNIVVLLQIIKKPVWWILLFFIPFVNIIIQIIVTHRVSRSFGHDVGFTLGLLFLSIIFYPILAFGSSKYTRH